MLRFDSVSKSYGDGEARVRALQGVNLDIPDGEMCAVMGPSGAGKSTLLNVASGLTRFEGGEITVGLRSLSGLSADELTIMRRREVGVVFQFFNLLPYLSAFENVAFPLEIDDIASEECAARTSLALEAVDMQHREHHLPHEMSGGELQRVAIARALAIEPRVVLADEPTGNLDSDTSRLIMELLRDINDNVGVTMMIITHDPVSAAVCDRVVRIVDGKVSQDIGLADADNEESLGIS